LIDAATAGEPPPGQTVDYLNTVSSDDPETVTLEAGAVARRSSLPGAVARSAIELAAGSGRRRLARCSAPGCGMVFIAGRAGQRWCCASCGNRARVARHHARRRRALSTNRGRARHPSEEAPR
jgi:predicted RNA-binding Zn ribbon-like protein